MTATLLLLQVVSGSPLRLGTVGRQLSESEVADLVVTVKARPTDIWLVHARKSQLPGSRVVQIFFQSETNRHGVHRGRVDTVRQDHTGRMATGVQGWQVLSSGRYGQVVMKGRDCRRDLSDNDACLPFLLSADLPDEDVESVVTFIRSSPGGVRGGCPIYSMGASGKGTVGAFLLCGDFEGQNIEIGRRNEHWVVLDVRNIIA